ncbi:MAG: Y-family DNA polymerase [Pseudobacter sp.]|uniref:Y-family DNA polymerase n=1 Tax=Pseudobacter sp. TaxID=2045420 RepID=UPI003F7F9938
MSRRYVSIWFRYLVTDWLALRQPELLKQAFATAIGERGRMVIAAASPLAEAQGIHAGMPVADVRALLPGFQVIDHKPDIEVKLLKAIAEWCIRFTPVVSIDNTDGLLLDATGCAHLWGGEEKYLEDITQKLRTRGYQVRVAIADTIGAAWAISRYAQDQFIIAPDQQLSALLPLPAAALRIDAAANDRLQKLGLHTVASFIRMPASTLRRRFGERFLQRLHQAMGSEEEFIVSIQPVVPVLERLPCLEPIVTATGIEIAVKQLLSTCCKRLTQEGKGIRQAQLKCFRVDGKIETVDIGTSRASQDEHDLFKLFELKLPGIEPGLGIELFLLEISKVEKVVVAQEQIWHHSTGLQGTPVAQLIDRIAGKLGSDRIRRYLPVEHYLPERSLKSTTDLTEQPATHWKKDTPRPLFLLAKPEPIAVTAPIPDYPPMNFRYNGVLHKVMKADGPERIEQAWWIKDGQHRDYYAVEDEHGKRYWLFRAGHYDATKKAGWYLHGFFS